MSIEGQIPLVFLDTETTGLEAKHSPDNEDSKWILDRSEPWA